MSTTQEIFDAWRIYTTLRLHFTSDKYDFIKYQGKARNLTVEAFHQRKDKRYFYVLAKKHPGEDRLINYIVASMVVNSKIYPAYLVGDEAEKNYKNWSERQENIAQKFKEDLGKIEEFRRDFSVIGGQYPQVLSLFLADEISVESLAILNSMLKLDKAWSGKMNDPVTWPEISMKLRKYHPFIRYDHSLVKQIFIDKFDINKQEGR